MVKSCLVATCKNTLGKPGITFHKIGKKRYADRLKAIGRSVDDCLSPQNVICSIHYSEDDFFYFNRKKYLRLEALPRFFIPRRPVFQQATELNLEMTRSVTEDPEEPNESINMDMLNILSKEELQLLCKDFLNFAPQDDNDNDKIINDVMLSQYPSNEFLKSLLSEGCENLDFDTSSKLYEF